MLRWPWLAVSLALAAPGASAIGLDDWTCVPATAGAYVCGFDQTHGSCPSEGSAYGYGQTGLGAIVFPPDGGPPAVVQARGAYDCGWVDPRCAPSCEGRYVTALAGARGNGAWVTWGENSFAGSFLVVEVWLLDDNVVFEQVALPVGPPAGIPWGQLLP